VVSSTDRSKRWRRENALVSLAKNLEELSESWSIGDLHESFHLRGRKKRSGNQLAFRSFRQFRERTDCVVFCENERERGQPTTRKPNEKEEGEEDALMKFLDITSPEAVA